MDQIVDEAYQDLATCRVPMFGDLGQIPWTAIHTWSYEHGFFDLKSLKIVIWRIDDHIRNQLRAEYERNNK